jgi:hypothetical protein
MEKESSLEEARTNRREKKRHPKMRMTGKGMKRKLSQAITG